MFLNFQLPERMFIHPGLPSARIYWPYLLSALLITFLVFLFQKDKDQKLSLKSFFNFSFPPSVYGHKSTQLDMLFFLINQLVYGLLFIPFLVSSPLIAHSVWSFLHHLFGAPEIRIPSNFWTILLVTVTVILFDDFAKFISHYFHHKWKFLWNFHKVHHSAEVLNPLTFYRAHPVDLFILGSLTALASGVAIGVFNYFAAVPFSAITILKVNVVYFLFHLVGSNLRHSHVWVSYPPFLSHIFISPAQHQIHHSNKEIHFDKNFGSIFAFWDYLFKSLYVPKGEEQFPMGLSREEHTEFNGLWNLYYLPFKKNAEILIHRFSGVFKRNPGKPSLPKDQAA